MYQEAGPATEVKPGCGKGKDYEVGLFSTHLQYLQYIAVQHSTYLQNMAEDMAHFLIIWKKK